MVDGKFGHYFFTEVSFCGHDDSRVVCLARRNLWLVNVDNLSQMSCLLGSTPTSPGKLKKSINCMATHPDLTFVAVGTVSGYIELWDIERHDHIGEMKIGEQLIEKVQFSHHGQWLAARQSNRGITLMDIRAPDNLEVLGRFEKQRSRVLAVSFDRDDTQIVCVSEDKTVVIAPLIVTYLYRVIACNNWCPHQCTSTTCSMPMDCSVERGGTAINIYHQNELFITS
jgi:WD40 repeat protein